MTYRAEIDIMPHPELLDPQGKAVISGLKNLHLADIIDVRVGRHITLKLDAATEADAKKQVEEACKKLLANAIMEGYSFTLYSE
jgi:phosphoribosylformylglycinamidine synthase subunit PurS